MERRFPAPRRIGVALAVAALAALLSAAPAAAGQTRAPASGSVGSAIDDNPREAIALGVGALVLVIGLVPLLLRRKKELAVTAIDHELFAEGHSNRDDIGAFSGFAHAMASTEAKPGEEPQEVMYLISDARRPAPFWVRLDEVTCLTNPLRRVIGYASMTPAERTAGGDSLAEQRGQIREECRRRGWQLLEVAADVPPVDGPLERAGLGRAMELIATGAASALVATSLERLGDSAADLAQLVERFDTEEASLVVLDPNVDLSTDAGRLVARAIGSVSALELAGAMPAAAAEASVPATPEEPVSAAVIAEDHTALVDQELEELRKVASPGPAAGAEGLGDTEMSHDEVPGLVHAEAPAMPAEPAAAPRPEGTVDMQPEATPGVPGEETSAHPGPLPPPPNGGPVIAPRRSGSPARGTRSLLARWLQSR